MGRFKTENIGIYPNIKQKVAKAEKWDRVQSAGVLDTCNFVLSIPWEVISIKTKISHSIRNELSHFISCADLAEGCGTDTPPPPF